MSEQGQRAEALFCAGAGCAQATLGAFADELGLNAAFAARLASGFGGGLGRQREICGAVSGICMAAGLFYGYSEYGADEEKTATYEMIRLLCARFVAQNGSIKCRVLLGLSDAPETAEPDARTAAYYEARPCAGLCRSAADILAAYRAERDQKEHNQQAE